MTIADGVAAAIIEHAKEDAPRECCGLLLGTNQHIVRAVRARNVADDPRRRYVVDPRDHFSAIRRARNEGLQVIGGYHSHPSSAPRPSPTDAAEALSHFLYVIVGLNGPAAALTGWCWQDGNFTAVPLVRVAKGNG